MTYRMHPLKINNFHHFKTILFESKITHTLTITSHVHVNHTRSHIDMQIHTDHLEFNSWHKRHVNDYEMNLICYKICHTLFAFFFSRVRSFHCLPSSNWRTCSVHKMNSTNFPFTVIGCHTMAVIRRNKNVIFLFSNELYSLRTWVIFHKKKTELNCVLRERMDVSIFFYL